MARLCCLMDLDSKYEPNLAMPIMEIAGHVRSEKGLRSVTCDSSGTEFGKPVVTPNRYMAKCIFLKCLPRLSLRSFSTEIMLTAGRRTLAP